MSIDQLAFILENCHACRIVDWRYGKVLIFRLYAENNEQQIEIETSVFERLKRRYPDIVGKWIGEEQ
jgi:hypothetical protein